MLIPCCSLSNFQKRLRNACHCFPQDFNSTRKALSLPELTPGRCGSRALGLADELRLPRVPGWRRHLGDALFRRRFAPVRPSRRDTVPPFGGVQTIPSLSAVHHSDCVVETGQPLRLSCRQRFPAFLIQNETRVKRVNQ